MPGPRKATRIQTKAQQIKDVLEGFEGMDWYEYAERVRKLADEIIDMAQRADARTGRLDPRLRRKTAKKRS